jgi:3'-5' exoribonuclease
MSDCPPILSIRELKQKATRIPVPGVVHAQADRVERKESRNGNPYIELRLVDAEDQFTLRVWSDGPAFPMVETVEPTALVALAADWEQNEFGIDARSLKVRGLSPEEVTQFFGLAPEILQRQAADYASIRATVNALADPRLKALCTSFLDQHGERFQKTAAARRNHHARRGGLVEHVAQMMRTAVAIQGVYPMLNRDLLVAGVLFHDCGKLWENYCPEGTFQMPHSMAGELLSHIPFGMELVNKLWRELKESDQWSGWEQLEPTSEDVRLHLLHLIASHHGELQFGSPVPPKTPEAFALHYVDNLDARLEMVKGAYANSQQLAEGIFAKAWPLPGHLVTSLPKFAPATAPSPAEATDEEAEDEPF